MKANRDALLILFFDVEVFPTTSFGLADIYRTSRILTTSLTITPLLTNHLPFYSAIDGYCIIIGLLEWLIARPYRSSRSFFFLTFYLGKQFVDIKCFSCTIEECSI